nr:ribonuclease H-like domain-containing protein [Tanacetum cinerariifolium]
MTGNLKLLTNFVEKFLGTVKFGNDPIAPILGYGNLVQGTVTIKRVYYVEGLNHNLFSVDQFGDADLEVAFWKSICYIHDLKGNDLLTGDEIGVEEVEAGDDCNQRWDIIGTLAPENNPSTTTTSTTSGDKSGRTGTLTTEDIQKKKNDVKARTTLLLSLPDEHQLRFSKYKTAKELWAAILKTFGGNEATKKTKKNLLKQQYENFRDEGAKTLEQTFTRLQVIVVWRNMSDLDTMSLDDLYNHLKVYEVEVQKKSEPNTQNMAFISSTKHSRGNDELNTASVYTASSNVPTASANVSTDWSYMANDEEDHALIAKAPTEFAPMADTSTENKVFDNSLCSKDCKKNNDSLNSKITDLTDKLFDAKNMIHHYKLALAQVESRLVEYKEREVKYIEKIRTLEFYDKGKVEYIETLKKELETLKQEKEVVDGKLAGLLSASKNLDNLIESQ